MRGEPIKRFFHQEFSFRAGDEHIRVDGEVKPIKGLFASEIGQGFALLQTAD